MLNLGPPGYALLFAGVGRQFGIYLGTNVCVHIPHVSAIRHFFSTSGIDRITYLYIRLCGCGAFNLIGEV